MKNLKLIFFVISILSITYANYPSNINEDSVLPVTKPNDYAINNDKTNIIIHESLNGYYTSESTSDNDVTEAPEVTQCQEDIAQGVTFPVTNVGASVSIPCPTGTTGTLTRTCTTDGWGAISGSCESSTTQCSAEQSGGISWPATNAGETASVDCQEGYSGSKTRACSAEGTWGQVTDNCVQNRCRPEEFGGFSWPETMALENATLPCSEGMSGSIKRLCMGIGIWDREIVNTCAVSSLCSTIEEGGVSWPETAAGTVATVTCAAGFTGEMSRQCLESSEWGEITNNCVPIKCPSETVDSILYPETNANSTASVSCPVGQSGTKTRFCTLQGVWSAPQGVCTELSCPTQTSGYLTWPTTRATEEAEIVCPVGMRGPAKRVCNPDGTWGDITHECEGITCMANGMAWPETPANMVRQQPCPESTPGTIYRACLKSGDWSVEMRQCQTIMCPVDEVDGIIYPETQPGKEITQECGEGFEGFIKRQCSTEGRWERPINTCRRTKCPAEVIKTSTGDYQTVLSSPGIYHFACPSGFNGTTSIECMPSFTWSEPDELCIRASCSETVISGVQLEETPFGERVSKECSEGWTGHLMLSCSLEGEWTTPIEDCVQESCESDVIDGLTWETTKTGVTVEKPCSAKYPKKTGIITRTCGVNKIWGSVIEECSEAGTFSYSSSNLVLTKGEMMEGIMPSIEGNAVFSSQSFLPVGLELNPTTGFISGTPYIASTQKAFTIKAIAGKDVSTAVITITVNDNVCEEDGIWIASFIGQEWEEKCSFLGKERRSCNLNTSTGTAEWSEVASQCTMMIVIVVVVCIVVVLILALVAVILIRGASGHVHYNPKKAQRKMVELACV